MKLKFHVGQRVRLRQSYPEQFCHFIISYGDTGVIDSLINAPLRTKCQVRFDKRAHETVSVDPYNLAIIDPIDVLIEEVEG